MFEHFSNLNICQIQRILNLIFFFKNMLKNKTKKMKNVKNFTTCLCEPHLERPIEEISRVCGNPLARTRRIGGPHGYALVGGLFSLRSSSCLAQAHRCFSSLQSHRGTASSWGQSLRGSFLGLIRIAQIIPVEIV
jgi:hypothetical protein